ncbi:hypothetical protein [Parerythrobacter aestuarii]|uniref:hypothetical protein n=1 Tax=Parerythrobacter aestuarii TaxID=3020909 RepID=UPI0024DEAD88|nr:hypothetical protein [Parerythrobacter aestuarii]
MKKTVSKALIGTVAAGALAVSATPAMAEHRDRDGGISAGDVIAGAVILGGIAAIASAASRDRDGRYYNDRRAYRSNAWRQRGNNPRRAVERCVNAAEREARRYGYRFANVTDIRDVDDTRYGWRVKGRIVVDGQRGYGYQGYNYRGRYDDRYRYNDRYRYRQSERGYDKGKFTCYIERGRGASVDFSGIRGLH